MTQENDYHISFFRPTTARAKHNRNMVLWLISTWFVAIFGFHFLLRVLEKPTPEEPLISFNQVWSNVESGNATSEEIALFAKSALHVTGKVFIATEHREALDNGITWALFQLAEEKQKLALSEAIVDFEKEREQAETLKDPSYLAAKLKLGGLSQSILGLNPDAVLAKILPFELRSSGIDNFTTANKTLVKNCMPLYMTHNRSVLTDTSFLGFPFHYFYTAVFLLILFIALCFGYCLQVDRYHKKIGIAE